MPNKPLKVGITGGIGAGKTLVCQMFRILGIPVYNADERAKLLMVQDDVVIDSIKNLFGEKAYIGDRKLNVLYLANHVFSDKEKLSLLNGVVHPAVAKDFESWQLNYQKEPYLIKEAALLVESKSYKVLTYLVTVTAPIDLRIARVLARDKHRTVQNIEDIISRQLSDEEKIAKSEFVIVNDNNSLLIPQVLDIHLSLINSLQID